MNLTLLKSENDVINVSVLDDRIIAIPKHVAEIDSTSATFYSDVGCIRVYFDGQLAVEVVKYDIHSPKVTQTVVSTKKE